MPDEFRFLVFSPSEAVDAFSAFAIGPGKPVPRGRVVAAQPVGEKTITARLSVDDGSGGAADVPLGAEQVLEALIAFCIARGIPLPRVSEKTLERLHGRFALRIGQVDSMEHQWRTHAPRRR